MIEQHKWKIGDPITCTGELIRTKKYLKRRRVIFILFQVFFYTLLTPFAISILWPIGTVWLIVEFWDMMEEWGTALMAMLAGLLTFYIAGCVMVYVGIANYFEDLDMDYNFYRTGKYCKLVPSCDCGVILRTDSDYCFNCHGSFNRFCHRFCYD